MTVPAGLRPEFAFLVHATRWPHNAEAVALIRRTARGIRDPDLLLALARRHHVVSLVARALGHCEGILDVHWRASLSREALALAEEQFRQLVQTRQAVEALRREGVAVAVLKGVPAALDFYGEAGIRSSVDIDLLVDRRDIVRAAQVLERLDYLRSDPPHDAIPARVRTAARYSKDWGFDHYHTDTGIELHWRLFQNPHLLGDVGVAEAADREVAPGISLPLLPRRIAVLYAAVHGAEHAWARLKWLADLAAILRRDPAAADRLMADARDRGLAHVATAALMLAGELYGTPLPAASRVGWRAGKLFEIARESLIGRQDGTELEDCAGASTRKNLSHYLFRADPRFWWRELAYDLFHDADQRPVAKIAQRGIKVLQSQLFRAKARPEPGL